MNLVGSKVNKELGSLKEMAERHRKFVDAAPMEMTSAKNGELLVKLMSLITNEFRVDLSTVPRPPTTVTARMNFVLNKDGQVHLGQLRLRHLSGSALMLRHQSSLGLDIIKMDFKVLSIVKVSWIPILC